MKRPFREALINAFDQAGLARVLTFHCDRHLYRISSEKVGFEWNVDEVINDAVRNGWLEKLAQGALAENKRHTGLKATVPHLLVGVKVEGKSYYQSRDPYEEIKPTKSFDPKIEPETILIPAGPFLMGRMGGVGVAEYETPQHEVILPDFRIGRFPVTQRLYERFIRENKKHDPPNNWFNCKPPNGLENHPVSSVTWKDAMEYCRWLSKKTGRHYRLPSEAEWEKAASWVSAEDGGAGEKRLYPWNNEWLDGRCNVAGEGTTLVTKYPDGASAYGVLDLLGNVQEWTRSAWGNDTRRPEFGYDYDPDEDGRELQNVEDLPPQMRVIHRGGSYRSKPGRIGNTRRGHAAPTSRITWGGFRVVIALE